MNFLSEFMRDENGATAIEYGLIAAILGVGLIASLQGLKNSLISTFNNIGTNLSNAN